MDKYVTVTVVSSKRSRQNDDKSPVQGSPKKGPACAGSRSTGAVSTVTKSPVQRSPKKKGTANAKCATATPALTKSEDMQIIRDSDSSSSCYSEDWGRPWQKLPNKNGQDGASQTKQKSPPLSRPKIKLTAEKKAGSKPEKHNQRSSPRKKSASPSKKGTQSSLKDDKASPNKNEIKDPDSYDASTIEYEIHPEDFEDSWSGMSDKTSEAEENTPGWDEHEPWWEEAAKAKEEPKPQEKLKRKTRGIFFSQRRKQDLMDYRAGYPGLQDNPRKNKNLAFYMNRISSEPNGAKIDCIHKDWFYDYERLEAHHGYIQWLFPIREHGMNMYSQDLQSHEAKDIRASPVAMKRVLKSYEMMLNFYGVKFKDASAGGTVERAANWKQRFKHLNRSHHNYLRITRILKSLGELGYEHYKVHLVDFLLKEACEHRTLTNIIDSCIDYWIETIRNDAHRKKLMEYAKKHVETRKT